MAQKHPLGEGTYVELSPTRSTPEDRAATIMAFALNLPIVFTRDDGTVFAYMLPDNMPQTDEDA
jgi:hypothetical protein